MPVFQKSRSVGKWFGSDERFNLLYPQSIQALAQIHWTPLRVAKKVACFLASEENTRILDIGSGVGKFCLAAAYFKPNAFYYGVEQRQNLVNQAAIAKAVISLNNITFYFGNFTQMNFKNYDHFFLHNSFYENLPATNTIDNDIEYSPALYNYYNHYLKNQLDQKPAGTRLATFECSGDEVPAGYHLEGTDMNGLLKFWIKI